ncbi:calmodulin-regulated spectrin-associated protein 3 isoform X2 [Ambystoma mexicanum]|uniref:calmodulin-regulated spectrin-associated protein 3 isoform X2 n=1 Tax=Ambystoma mexicanum TaxID=8296 RepID=UPI0037E8E4B8
MVDAAAEPMNKSFQVPEIRPLDQYDHGRAKVCASLAWVLAKAYGADRVPDELREPFYTDQYDQEHIKPPVIRLLLSSDIYCRACRQALPVPDDGASPRDHAAVLQFLGRQGLAPTDQDKPVKDADLRQSPIRMGTHLAVIDALMAAFAEHCTEALSVPAAVEQSPGAWENKLLYWVDKINRRLHESAERDLSQRQTPTSDGQAPPPCPTRWYWKLVPIRYRKDKVLPKQTPCFPGISGVKDLANGCAIAATIHYYCPEILRLEDVCLKETMSVADSLYNLQLIQEFCTNYLSGSCPLTLEDLLYVSPVLKTNIGAFLADLYRCFEVVKPEFVQPKPMAESEDSPGFLDSPSPISGNSQSASPVFTFRHPLLPGGQLQSPGSMHHSTSMSQVDGFGKVEGFGKTWSKKQLSHPLSQAVSFSIPFGLDSDVDIVMGNPVSMMRSVSSDSLAPKTYSAPKRTTRSTYTPPEDVPEYTVKDDPRSNPNGQVSAPRTIRKMQLSNKPGGKEVEAVDLPLENGPVDGPNSHELPTIEEALQIIHSSERLEPRLHPEGAADGFYLHSPEMNEGLAKPRSPRHSRIEGQAQEEVREMPNAAVYRLHNGPSNGRSATESHRMSRDDDSVLRDNSLDSDAEDRSRLPLEKDPGSKDDCMSCQSSLSSQPDSSTSSSSGVKMTSFAERKKKLATDVKPGGSSGSPKATSEPIAIPTTTTWAQKAEESPSKSPALNSEMNQLGARLEEKRRAIEAQKKRIEAIFTKHRQRLGKSAFLQLKKKDGGDGEVDPEEGDDESEEKKPTLEERLSRIDGEDMEQKPSPMERTAKDRAEENNNVETASKGRSDKQVTFSPEITKGGLDDNLGDYNRAVAKLNSALSSLQNDMQRLSDQQQKLMHQEKSKAWVIPAPSSKNSVLRPTREFVPPRSVELSSSSPSPSPSRRTSAHLPKSPQTVPKKPQPPPPTLPKSPKHTRPVELKLPPLTRVLTPPNNVDNLPRLRKFSPSKVTVQTRSSLLFSDDEYAELASIVDGAESDFADTNSNGENFLCMDNVGIRRPVASVMPQSTSTSGDGTSSEVSSPGEKRASLIEIPLSALRFSEDSGGDGDDSLEESIADDSGPGQRSGVGFFFKDEQKPEDEMAQRRAFLLERQQKRAEEVRKRKQLLEAEKEQKKEETKQLQEEEKPKEVEVGARRGDFTRQEHMRRQQLKIMEDLDKVLRQKPTTVRAVKKGRPKTVFRDDSVISRSPVRNLMGSKLSKVYSQSTMSLSTVGNDTGNMLSVKRSPRSPRASSPSGLMSPSRLMFRQNGEQDWENASTASSPCSIPEYTGPKLYKEPSAKSNKYIIHNALSHCCLAGKVNESQKNKTLEEMEKSSGNHFLILFRDASCQFRAVYSFSPEMDEFTRLTGYGPKTICRSMIEGFYKYSSDRKRFTPIPSKTMSMSVDAVTIQGHLWQTKRPTTPKRPGTPK